MSKRRTGHKLVVKMWKALHYEIISSLSKTTPDTKTTQFILFPIDLSAS